MREIQSARKHILQENTLIPLLIGIVTFGLWYYHFIHPYFGKPLFDSKELSIHVRLVQSAQASFAEGQFPPRYINDSALKLQPFFLYYTPVFYSVAGGLQLLFHFNAYDSLLVAVALFSAVAGVGLYFLTRELGCSAVVAALTFPAFVLSPYFVTNLYARSALAELSFFCLLPLACHAALLQARRPGFAPYLYLTLCLAVVIISHKIFSGWLLILLSLIHLSQARLDPQRAIIFGSAVLTGMLICSPYWLNAWLNVENLNVSRVGLGNYLELYGHLHKVAFDGVPSRLGILVGFLTSNLWIFSPIPYTHPLSTTPHLHLQIGSLAGIALLLAIVYGRKDRRVATMFAATLLGVGLVCSFWMLFPFWRFVPRQLQVIQFPYRLLTFASLAGCLLAACLADYLVAKKKYLALTLLIGALIFQGIAFNWKPGLTPLVSRDVEKTEYMSGDYWEPGMAPEPPGKVVSIDFHVTAEPGRARIAFDLPAPLVADCFLKVPVSNSRYLTVLVDDEPAAVFQEGMALVVAAKRGLRRIVITRNEPIGFAVALGGGGMAIATAYLIWFRNRASSGARLGETALG